MTLVLSDSPSDYLASAAGHRARRRVAADV